MGVTNYTAAAVIPASTLRFARLAIPLLLIGCSGEPSASKRSADAPRVASGTPVILVSIDTLRSDRLPIYGYQGVETPAIDRLREDSVMWQRAYTHVGLTLPSHSTIMTGLLPAEHGVRDNLGYTLEGESLPLLARDLSERGYATGGFVSSYVLRSATGMSQGFDVYDDAVETPGDRELGAYQRSGDRTLARALGWLDGVGDRPFFLFLHLYEPHSPYEPSEPYASRYASPYDAEVAEADAIVGHLMAELERRGLYDQALLVLLSDHGEGLGDHGEQEHEVLIYREVLQVPLLIKLPQRQRAGEFATEPVGLIDVAPTLHQLLGLEPAAGHDGRPLFALPQAPEQRALYAESLYPRLHLGWHELHSVIRGPWHLLVGARAELFDLDNDPAETRDVSQDQRSIARELRALLDDIDRTFEQPGQADQETRDALASLGYLSSGSAANRDRPLPDPRDRLHIIQPLMKAGQLVGAGQPGTAVPIYEQVVVEEPEMVLAWQALGRARNLSGDERGAIDAYRRALDLSGGAPEIAMAAARVHFALGEYEVAEPLARSALPYQELAWDLLTHIAIQRQQLDQAESLSEQAIAHRGSHIAPLLTRIQLLLYRERYADALTVSEQVEREFGERRDRDSLRGLYLHKGRALTALGQLQEAQQALRTEIDLRPDALSAYSILAFAYAADGKVAEMQETFKAMLETNDTAVAHAEAVRAIQQLGDPASAGALLRRALERWPDDPGLRRLAG